MSKIKRNDPCPCGSGKKYKKCCGANTINTNQFKSTNEELNYIHQELISFTINKYETKLNKQIKSYQKSSLQDNGAITDVYNTGLIIWIMFHVAFLENNKTIFDNFYRIYASKLSPQAKNILSKWAESTPSAYEVTSVEHKKQVAAIKEISTNKIYIIPSHKKDELIVGSIIIGSLVPFINYHNFVYTMIKLYRQDSSAMNELVDKYNQASGGLHEHFPEFLADALMQGADELKWDHPFHEEIGQLLANHLVEKDISDRIIMEGVKHWNKYCQQENPIIQKPNSYAAALEYFVQRSILGNSSITQKQIAEEYNTSPGSVSTNFRKLSNVLGNQ
ncbi:YecA family protein [Oceanobacillus halotolerans]|uniref:YecA family protein n=1 Tax=Oceanobacillus halotolerans TaxID=2663380 RepID=UPI0013DA42E3|nr:SEC-C metal-binding domain-containing protein [Oceanobacillus halotolerans]